MAMKEENALQANTRRALFSDVAPNCHYCGRRVFRRAGTHGFPDHQEPASVDSCTSAEASAQRSRLMFIDHIHPKARGGNNSRSNLVPCCFGCNSSKNAVRTYDEMVERRMAR